MSSFLNLQNNQICPIKHICKQIIKKFKQKPYSLEDSSQIIEKINKMNIIYIQDQALRLIENTYFNLLKNTKLGWYLLTYILKKLDKCEPSNQVRFLFFYCQQFNNQLSKEDKKQHLKLAFNINLKLKKKLQIGFICGLKYLKYIDTYSQINNELSKIIVYLKAQVVQISDIKHNVNLKNSTTLKNKENQNNQKKTLKKKLISSDIKIIQKQHKTKAQKFPFYLLLYQTYYIGKLISQIKLKKQYYNECSQQIKQKLLAHYPGRQIQRILISIENKQKRSDYTFTLSQYHDVLNNIRTKSLYIKRCKQFKMSQKENLLNKNINEGRQSVEKNNFTDDFIKIKQERNFNPQKFVKQLKNQTYFQQKKSINHSSFHHTLSITKQVQQLYKPIFSHSHKQKKQYNKLQILQTKQRNIICPKFENQIASKQKKCQPTIKTIFQCQKEVQTEKNEVQQQNKQIQQQLSIQILNQIYQRITKQCQKQEQKQIVEVVKDKNPLNKIINIKNIVEKWKYYIKIRKIKSNITIISKVVKVIDKLSLQIICFLISYIQYKNQNKSAIFIESLNTTQKVKHKRELNKIIQLKIEDLNLIFFFNGFIWLESQFIKIKKGISIVEACLSKIIIKSINLKQQQLKLIQSQQSNSKLFSQQAIIDQFLVSNQIQNTQQIKQNQQQLINDVKHSPITLQLQVNQPQKNEVQQQLYQKKELKAQQITIQNIKYQQQIKTQVFEFIFDIYHQILIEEEQNIERLLVSTIQQHTRKLYDQLVEKYLTNEALKIQQQNKINSALKNILIQKQNHKKGRSQMTKKVKKIVKIASFVDQYQMFSQIFQINHILKPTVQIRKQNITIQLTDPTTLQTENIQFLFPNCSQASLKRNIKERIVNCLNNAMNESKSTNVKQICGYLKKQHLQATQFQIHCAIASVQSDTLYCIRFIHDIKKKFIIGQCEDSLVKNIKILIKSNQSLSFILSKLVQKEVKISYECSLTPYIVVENIWVVVDQTCLSLNNLKSLINISCIMQYKCYYSTNRLICDVMISNSLNQQHILFEGLSIQDKNKIKRNLNTVIGYYIKVQDNISFRKKSIQNINKIMNII